MMKTPSRFLNLLSYFDDRTLEKGRDYFRRGKVLTYQLLAPDSLRGSVSGSGRNEYQCLLFLNKALTEIQDAGCSCPVYRDCKHTAALIFAFLADKLQENSDTGMISSQSVQAWMHSTTSSGTRPSLSTASPRQNSHSALPTEVTNSFKRLAAIYSSKIYSGKNDSRQEDMSARRTTLIYKLTSKTWTSDPTIDLVCVSLQKDGSFGAERGSHLEQLLSRNPPKYALPEDIQIAKLWEKLEQDYYWDSTTVSMATDSQLLRVLLERILATNRCYFDSTRNPPLQLGAPLPGSITWEKNSNGQLYLAVVAEDEGNKHYCLPWRFPWYIDRDKWLCGPINLDLNSEVVDSILTMRAITDKESKNIPLLLHELELSSLIPPPPGANTIEIRLIKPVPELKVENLPVKNHFLTEKNVVLNPGEKARTAIISVSFPTIEKQLDQPGKTILEKHDTPALEELKKQVENFGFSEVPALIFGKKPADSQFFIPSTAVDWLNFDTERVSQLRSLGWLISGDTETKLLPIELDSSDLEFEIAENDNFWFSLSLNIEVNGKTIPLLPILISAIRSLPAGEKITEGIDQLSRDGKFYGQLPDGNLICIQFDRIRAILLSVQELIQKGLEPKTLKASLLHAAELLEDENLANARWIGAKRILDLAKRLQELKTITAAQEPVSFGTTLRPYQTEGLAWLQFLAKNEFGGILADDMGLGKTVQLLAHICLEKEKNNLTAPFLVVCPTSVLPNWLSESARFAPQLKTIPFYGIDRYGSLASLKKADLVVTTYPLLARDINTLKNIRWYGLALDEAQAIKNSATKMAQAACSLKANYRFCLTGTPVENHLGELWSQFQFLLPGLLGDKITFKRCMRDPIEKFGDLVRKKSLSSRVRPFILRRTKQEVAKELPEKTVILHKVELEGTQRDLYETVRLTSTKQVRDEISKKGFKHSQIMILDALLKLRQVCCDPRLVKLSAAGKVKKSAKLEALMEMIEPLVEEGRKILIFSQFTSMLQLIEKELIDNNLLYVKLTGDTKDRATPVKHFQEGNVPIFLISLKAGGTGLNLTAADVVIHYDPWWNPAVEEQATDRAHRIGQKKKVFVYKLIAEGTLEERMLELQERKRALAMGIYDDRGNLGVAFNEADLHALLKPIEEL